ncbi:MAG: hypothetical protein HYT30_00460 [Parcubacteria group bacterium]|nr:hypothetical protein [Parcubacteria group bacterium]
MNRIIVLMLVLAAGIIAFVAYDNGPATDNPALADFAQCLAKRGAVMYGADWCPHCQEEKAAFGAAFRFINYVECPEEPKRCLAAGIENYPTWIFPASPAGGPDGQKLAGRQSLERLAELSDCTLPFPIKSWQIKI